jgi:hypothetical protein
MDEIAWTGIALGVVLLIIIGIDIWTIKKSKE